MLDMIFGGVIFAYCFEIIVMFLAETAVSPKSRMREYGTRIFARFVRISEIAEKADTASRKFTVILNGVSPKNCASIKSRFGCKGP